MRANVSAAFSLVNKLNSFNNTMPIFSLRRPEDGQPQDAYKIFSNETLTINEKPLNCTVFINHPAYGENRIFVMFDPINANVRTEFKSCAYGFFYKYEQTNELIADVVTYFKEGSLPFRLVFDNTLKEVIF